MTSADPVLAAAAAGLVVRCAVRPGETVTLLADDGTLSVLEEAVADAIERAGGSPRTEHVAGRSHAFQELPDGVLGRLLTPGLTIDLTSLPWLYSDAFSRYARECRAAGSRLALVWGDAATAAALRRCPPDAALFARAEAAAPLLRAARELTIRSDDGTDFRAMLADNASFIGAPPIAAGDVSAPLYASVTAPFVPGSAEGVLVFAGSGRVQGPIPAPFVADEPVRIAVEEGCVKRITGEASAARLLRSWRSAAPSPEVDRLMDCNVGFDPRGDLAAADNMTVHCYAGGIMIGIGSPYEERPGGSLRPGYHLDVLFTGCDVALDGVRLVAGGRLIRA